MAEQQKEESQKTVVSFVVGLLVGGLLVWAFTGTPENTPTDKMDDKNSEETVDKMTDDKTTDDATKNDSAPAVEKMQVGEGAVKLEAPAAGKTVALDSATFPTKEGWVGVRDYNDGQLGGLLGVARYSEEQGLIPKEIILQRATESGKQYAIVFYTESGDRKFNLAEDVQINKEFATFTAK